MQASQIGSSERQCAAGEIRLGTSRTWDSRFPVRMWRGFGVTFEGGASVKLGGRCRSQFISL